MPESTALTLDAIEALGRGEDACSPFRLELEAQDLLASGALTAEGATWSQAVRSGRRLRALISTPEIDSSLNAWIGLNDTVILATNAEGTIAARWPTTLLATRLAQALALGTSAGPNSAPAAVGAEGRKASFEIHLDDNGASRVLRFSRAPDGGYATSQTEGPGAGLTPTDTRQLWFAIIELLLPAPAHA